MKGPKDKLNRRNFFSTVAVAGASVALTGACKSPTPAVHSRKLLPNVVLVTSDQQRADAVGYVSGDRVITPNIDRLAARGVSFTGCHSANPVCIPSRMSTYSGLLPHRHFTSTVW